MAQTELELALQFEKVWTLLIHIWPLCFQHLHTNIITHRKLQNLDIHEPQIPAGHLQCCSSEASIVDRILKDQNKLLPFGYKPRLQPAAWIRLQTCQPHFLAGGVWQSIGRSIFRFGGVKCMRNKTKQTFSSYCNFDIIIILVSRLKWKENWFFSRIL